MPLNAHQKSRLFRFRSLILMVILTGLLGCSAFNHYIQSDYQWQSSILQDHPLVGDIVRVQDKKRLQPQQLLEELRAADYLLIGEKHDNPDHHHLQNWLLTHLLSKDRYQLVFEMMNFDQQTQLEALSNTSSKEDILKATNLGQSGWEAEHYLPLVETGLAKGARIVGGNIPKETMMSIYKTGLSSLTSEARFDSLDAISEANKEAIQEEIFQQHCKMIAIKQTTPMANIQIAKDASLSFSMLSDQDTKSMLIAGNYHVSKSVGVPIHLTKRTPLKKTLVIQFIEVSKENPTLETMESASLMDADYVWFTPKWTNKDYCDDMKIMHKRTKTN